MSGNPQGHSLSGLTVTPGDVSRDLTDAYKYQLGPIIVPVRFCPWKETHLIQDSFGRLIDKDRIIKQLSLTYISAISA